MFRVVLYHSFVTARPRALAPESPSHASSPFAALVAARACARINRSISSSLSSCASSHVENF
jgi:hypothetical protein